jgi:hypothetical protein
MVTQTVNGYFKLVRDQVDFAAQVTASIRDIIINLEATKIGSTPLFDYPDNIDHTNSTTGERHVWTVKTAGSAWQLVTYKSGTKSLEFDFRKVNGAYRGTAIVAGATVATRDPNGSTVWPEWIKVEFDSDADGAGTSSLVISLTGFRTQADIGTANFEQAIIKLTKGSDGVVTLGSIIKVPNSRHFVWNGYTKDTTTNTDTLNTAVTGETRYYCAAGRSSADGTKATVHLGIPTAVAAATVFADYGLGALIGQLFADRLNNNYDFDGTADTAYDQGGELIAALNSINPGDKDLATGSPAVNTAAKVREALVSAQSLVTTSNAWLDWLVGVTGVSNPVYFEASSFSGYGATAPAGYPTLVQADAAALLPTQAALDTLAIAFSAP